MLGAATKENEQCKSEPHYYKWKSQFLIHFYFLSTPNIKEFVSIFETFMSICYNSRLAISFKGARSCLRAR